MDVLSAVSMDSPATHTPSLIQPLTGLTRSDVGLVGGKAANLGELLAAGFPTPDGIVVTTQAHRKFLAGLSGVTDPARIEAAPMPTTIALAIRRALGDLAGVPVAVRSSAVAEDLAGTSFAGQYDTVLGCEGADAILEAVKHCWASTFSERVQKYRAERGIEPTAMAVVIQPLVQADAAGVAFTANPVTGARRECLVSAVKGLGDRLVSGEATPDEWVVRGDDVEITINPEHAIEEAAVREVAALARRAQDHFGSPQDIEWAIQDGTLFILQSRPITALPAEPVPLPVEPPEGFWEQDPSHWPDPPSPLFRGAVLDAINRSCESDFEWAGFLADSFAFEEIGGKVYNRLVPLGGKDRKPPPNWLVPIIMPIMRRLVPSLRRRIARCVEVYRNDEIYGAVQHWDRAGRDDMIARSSALRAIELESLSDQALGEHVRQCMAHVAYGMARHTRVALALSVVTGEFVLFAADKLAWEQHAVMELLTGTSEMSTAPARSLTVLGRLAAERPDVMEVLEAGGSGCEARLAAIDPGFAKAFAKHQYDYGCRGVRYDILNPSIGEDPGLLANLIVGQVRRGIDAEERERRAHAHRTEKLAQAHAVLADRPDDLAEFNRLLERASLAYPTREDNAYYTHGVPGTLLRFAALEAGRRLAERGDIDTRDDVFFLEGDELLAALVRPTDLREVVVHRRGQYTWALHADLPATFGTPPPKEPPPMGWMPEEMQRVMKALLWLFESSNEPTRSNAKQDGNGGIDGLAASPGVYEGTARVILSEEEFHKIEPGDVLVCRVTSPVWSVLFSNLGALVADCGGITSHQAIISREYGIPAVVATANATELLADGQRVRVDGSTGKVEVIA